MSVLDDIRLLISPPDHGSVLKLLEMLASPETLNNDKKAIIDTLGLLEDEVAVPMIGDYFRGENVPHELRIAAAKALGRIGGEDAINILERYRGTLASTAKASLRMIERSSSRT